MAHKSDGNADELKHLPLPIASAGIQVRVTPEQVAASAYAALQTTMTWGIGDDRTRLTEFSILQVGDLAITTGRTSPVASIHQPGEAITIKLCFAGGASYHDGGRETPVDCGDVLLFPNHGGRLICLEDSGICFQIEPARLARTLQVIHGCDDLQSFAHPFTLSRGEPTERREHPSSLFSLFAHIDRVLAENTFIPPALGLDEQIYRLLAIHAVRDRGAIDALRRHQSSVRRWSADLDDLIAYIRSHAHLPLTLTDLEQQSHYSGRQLQNLFREKFDCTPMQFVRRHRLTTAMQRLSEPTDDDSVIGIARECGYRHASNFCVDFQRQFGVTPSSVLRISRRQPTT